MGRRCTFVASAVAVIAVGSGSTALAAPPASDTTAASWCAPGGQLSVSTARAGFSAADCAVEDLTIVSGQARVRIPPRGQTVSTDVLTTRGSTVLTVTRDRSGNVAITTDPPQATEPPQRPSKATSACSSSGFAVLGYRIRGTYTWAYNPAGAPASVAAAAVQTLTAATGNITSGRNDCGLGTKPKTSHRYAGRTGATPGLSAAAQCAGNDGRSVTGWKSLTAPGVLAVTCTYSSGGVVLASDVAINTRFSWSVSARSCRNAYDLKGVMVHERGHTFGLDHSTADPGLTMYPSVRSCDFSKSTLGKGDVLGLVRIYGAA